MSGSVDRRVHQVVLAGGGSHPSWRAQSCRSTRTSSSRCISVNRTCQPRLPATVTCRTGLRPMDAPPMHLSSSQHGSGCQVCGHPRLSSSSCPARYPILLLSKTFSRATYPGQHSTAALSLIGLQAGSRLVMVCWHMTISPLSPWLPISLQSAMNPG